MQVATLERGSPGTGRLVFRFPAVDMTLLASKRRQALRIPPVSFLVSSVRLLHLERPRTPVLSTEYLQLPPLMSIVWRYCSSCPDKKFDINAVSTYEAHCKSYGHKLAVEARLAAERGSGQVPPDTQSQSSSGQDPETNVFEYATIMSQVSH